MKFSDDDLKQLENIMATHGYVCKISPLTLDALLARLEAAEAWGIAEREHRLDLQSNRLRTQRLADEAEEVWRKAKGE